MNGKKAKLLRKLVYPGDMSSRTRYYKTITYGQTIADAMIVRAGMPLQVRLRRL